MSVITLAIPATTANLGPGFDTLGLAVGLFNRFRVSPSDCDILTFSSDSTVDVLSAETKPGNSLFFQAVQAYYDETGLTRPALSVDIEAHIPLARGLGSSSSVIVAGLLAGVILSGGSDTPRDLLPLATRLEGHPDNVAPALLGGLQLCSDTAAFALPWPADWQISFVVPPYPLSTHTARKVMPAQYPTADAVANLRYTGLLVHALHTGNIEAMRQALNDTLHQPYRIPLIPEFGAIQQLTEEAGAIGTVISGAGPTIAVFTDSLHQAAVALTLDNWIARHAPPGYQRLDLPVVSLGYRFSMH